VTSTVEDKVKGSWKKYKEPEEGKSKKGRRLNDWIEEIMKGHTDLKSSC
jgi:hypothetical protein